MTGLSLVVTVAMFVALVVLAEYVDRRAERDRQSEFELRRELSRLKHPSNDVEWPNDET